MPDDNEIDIATFDYRALTLDQINLLKSAAFRRAHEERAECIRSSIHSLGNIAASLLASVHRVWARQKLRRRWLADIAVLRGMSDSSLKDMGLTRIDVEMLARRNVYFDRTVPR